MLTKPRVTRQGTRLLATSLLVTSLLMTLVAIARPAEAFTTKDTVRLNNVEARLVSRINSARTARGIAALRVAPGFTDVARRWAVVQASEQRMYHNPNMASQLQAAGGQDWRTLGENVGYGSDADSLFNAYWNSAPHRANILNPAFRYIGMGWVERPGGVGYNTQNFVSHYSTSYGRTRVPAYGGRADTRVVSSDAFLATFEGGGDQRVAAFASSGLRSSAAVDRAVDGTDNALRMSVSEVGSGSGGSAGVRMRDAVDLRYVRRISLTVGARSRSGRPVPIRVLARTAYGTTVVIGTFSVRSGTYPTVTLTMPSAARTWRNEILIDVTRTGLQSLSGSRSYRSAYISVYNVRMDT